MTITVDAIQSRSFGSWPHIGIEVFERGPAFADRDATAAIQRVFRRFGIEAALLHARVRAILAGQCHAVRALTETGASFPKIGRYRAQVLVSLAAAAHSLTIKQCELDGACFPPAVTSAPPCPVLSVSRGFRQDGEAAEALSDKHVFSTHAEMATTKVGQ